jgi:hypothetical protein
MIRDVSSRPGNQLEYRLKQIKEYECYFGNGKNNHISPGIGRFAKHGVGGGVN